LASLIYEKELIFLSDRMGKLLQIILAFSILLILIGCLDGTQICTDPSGNCSLENVSDKPISEMDSEEMKAYALNDSQVNIILGPDPEIEGGQFSDPNILTEEAYEQIKREFPPACSENLEIGDEIRGGVIYTPTREIMVIYLTESDKLACVFEKIRKDKISPPPLPEE